jgi:hypothetical protein
LLYNYALAAAGSSIALKLFLFFLNLQHAPIERYATFAAFLFLLLAVFFGIKKARVTEGNNGIKNDFRKGTSIALLNAIALSVFSYIYYVWIDSGYFDAKITHTIQLMKVNEFTREQVIEYYMNARLFFFAPDKIAFFTFFGYLLTGMIYSFVSALLLRKTV